MISFKRLGATAALFLAAAFCSTPAAAALVKTFVSGTGLDTNNCARNTPCRSFARALTQTVPTGEISCLDSDNFGAMNITFAVSIICDDVGASVFGNSIRIAAGDTDVVTIRGLHLDGFSSVDVGINFVSGAALHLHNVDIRRYYTNGLLIAPTSRFSSVFLDNVYIADNGITATPTTGGIRIGAIPGGFVKVSMENVRALNNENFGLRIDTGNAVNAQVRLVARSSNFTDNDTGVLLKAGGSGSVVDATFADSAMTQNGSYGVLVNGGGAKANFLRSQIVYNGIGLNALNGGSIFDRGNNFLYGNTTDGAWTGAPQPFPS